MNDVIKSFTITSTDSYVTIANLLREITMVRDNLLTLPEWFARGDIGLDDIIFSVCFTNT